MYIYTHVIAVAASFVCTPHSSIILAIIEQRAAAHRIKFSYVY
jgi:hypothetical protein